MEENIRFWKVFWKMKIPPKWKIFGWKILNNALPVAENLLKRGFQVQQECKFCGKEVETQSHLLRDCPMSRRIWKAFPLGLNLVGATMH